MREENILISKKISQPYFNRAYHHIRRYCLSINSIFWLSEDWFSKYHLIYFAENNLGLIIFKLNDINKVTNISVQITGKGVVEEDISDPYGQFVSKGTRYFQGLYLKVVRSRNSRVKKFSMIPTRMILN